MYARAVDDAADRLRELRGDEHGQLAVGLAALALAIAATQVLPELAIPLFIGGLVVSSLGVSAAWHRWDLVDRLAADRDAYVIPEVWSLASREASMHRRRVFAALLRAWLQSSASGDSGYDVACAEVEALVAELEDATLALDAAAAVACMRLVADPAGSPLQGTGLPPQDLLVRVRQVRAGFAPSDPPAA